MPTVFCENSSFAKKTGKMCRWISLIDADIYETILNTYFKITSNTFPTNEKEEKDKKRLIRVNIEFVQ